MEEPNIAKREGLRFSLRELLFATAGVAIFFGLCRVRPIYGFLFYVAALAVGSFFVRQLWLAILGILTVIGLLAVLLAAWLGFI